MTGAFLNAIGILLGALFGLMQRAPLSARTQDFFRRALGVAAVFLGLRLVWLHVNGTWWPCTKQLLIALLAVTLGNWVGRLLRLQKISNQLGRFATREIAATQSDASSKFAPGFVACAILFCAAPLGLLGAVSDGLAHDFYLLAMKAMMDGLAMAGFVRMFGWLSALSAFPVYVFIGLVTLVCQTYAGPLLGAPGLLDSVLVVTGLITCAIALVIFEVRKVELANYLPALIMAPILTKLIG